MKKSKPDDTETRLAPLAAGRSAIQGSPRRRSRRFGQPTSSRRSPGRAAAGLRRWGSSPRATSMETAVTVSDPAGSSTPRPGSIKGIALINTVKALRVHRQAARAVLSPSLRRYLKARVLVSEWYPDEDFLELLHAMTQVVPDPRMDVWEWAGRFGARADFEDLYSMMVKPGDPLETLRRYPRTWCLYHDSGQVDVTFPEAARAEVEIHHYLTTRVEFCRLQSGHMAEMLLTAGVSGVEVQNTGRATADEPARWRVSWQSG